MRTLNPHEAKICYNLYREGCFGSHWLLKDTVVSGFPSHELGEVKQAVDQLVRDGILGLKQSQHGEGVFINKELRYDVWERIREHDDFAWLPK